MKDGGGMNWKAPKEGFVGGRDYLCYWFSGEIAVAKYSSVGRSWYSDLISLPLRQPDMICEIKLPEGLDGYC